MGSAYAQRVSSGTPITVPSTENIATSVGSVGTATGISFYFANEARKKQDEFLEKTVNNGNSALERRIDELSRENLRIEKSRLKSDEEIRSAIRGLAARIKHIENHLTKTDTGFIPK
jgi:acyl-CoA hydrolase